MNRRLQRKARAPKAVIILVIYIFRDTHTMSSTSLELIGFSPSELAAYLSQPGNRHVVNEDRWYGMTHLHDACVKGSPAQVQALVRFGADVSAANAGGETPLHLGARRGIVAIAEELRKAGADLHARDQSGLYVWHCLSVSGGIVPIDSAAMNSEK